MRNTKRAIVVFCLLALTVYAQAAPVTEVDSATFDNKWECSQGIAADLPQYTWNATNGSSYPNAGWSYSGNGTCLGKAVAGDNPTTRVYSANVGTIPAGADITLELRAKVTSANGSVGYLPGLCFFLGNKQTYSAISIGTNGLYYQTETTPYHSMDSASAFHTYRFAYVASEKMWYSYVDGNLVSQAGKLGATSSNEGISFGQLFSASAAEWEIDYLRWDTDGAYAPVPEPATMGLLAVGGAAAMLRRRNR